MQLDEASDLGNDAQFTVFVRYNATEDYCTWNNFSFVVRLSNILHERKCLRK